jgi:hypothetical protein
MVGGAPSTSTHGNISADAWEAFLEIGMIDEVQFTLAIWQQVVLAIVAWYALAILLVRVTATDKDRDCAGLLFVVWLISPIVMVVYAGAICVFCVIKALGARVTLKRFFDW